MNNLKNKKILVSGADGFIGSHLVEALVDKGAHVRALVCYNSFNSYGWLDTLSEETLSKIEVVSGDIRDNIFISEITKGVDYVYHLAALIAIPYSYQAPKSYIDTNVNGTLNLLQAARENNVQKFIHTSTSEVYGSALYVPIDEKHPLQPQSPYSASKIAADQLALSYYYSFDLPVTIIRPFNTFGPRQSSRAVIPNIIAQLASGVKSVYLGSLSPTRDFLFVQDTVSGFIAAGEHQGLEGQTINLGTGQEISIGGLFDCICEVMEVYDATVVVEDLRIRPNKSEVQRLLANNQLAKILLHWNPKYCDANGFKKALKITTEWFCDSKNLARYKTNVYNI
jgi:NAD dependent epimerase/dehydratase